LLLAQWANQNSSRVNGSNQGQLSLTQATIREVFIGDIELSSMIDKCAAYTPVPGGVGPMTIAILIAQTVEAAEKSA